MDRFFPGSAQAGDRIAGGFELHGNVAPVVQQGEFAVDAGVIDFSGAWFMAARDIGHVEQSDLFDISFELFNQVSFGNLLVVEVVKKFRSRMVHLADDFEPFRN